MSLNCEMKTKEKALNPTFRGFKHKILIQWSLLVEYQDADNINHDL